jgi:membrane fusion protein (multidrug efflux system)
LLLLFLAAPAGCHRSAEDAEPAASPKRVRCAAATRQPLFDVVELRGTVSPLPDRDAQIAPQVGGRIVRLVVREGDRVAAGQVVAQIDAAPLVDQAKEADAVLAKVRAESRNAETTAARVERVFEHGIAARQEVDDAQARAASARAAEAEAAAAAQRAHRQLERASVRSPLGGLVLKVMRHSGELVDGTPATPIVEVGDPSQLELVSDAPAQDLVRIAAGNPATVTMVALPGREFRGRVAVVAPAVDRATGLGAIRIALDLGGGPAPPVGIYGQARITSGKPHQALVVPAPALRNAVGADAELVVCGNDRTAHLRKVQRGVTRDGVVEIRGGELQAGERVAVEPVLGIADGDGLEVLP